MAALWAPSHLPLRLSFYICKMKLIIAMTSEIYGAFCDYNRQMERVPDFKCHLYARDSDFHKPQTQISIFLLNTPNRHLQPPCPKLSSFFPHPHSYSTHPHSPPAPSFRLHGPGAWVLSYRLFLSPYIPSAGELGVAFRASGSILFLWISSPTSWPLLPYLL